MLRGNLNLPAKTYVVHYTRRPERLESVRRQLAMYDLPWEVILEYDREDITPDQMHEWYWANPIDWDRKVRDLWDVREHSFRILKPAELSCTFKHIEVMRRIAEGSEPWVMVLEDDAILEPNFAERFSEFFAETPKDWDAVWIGSVCNLHAKGMTEHQHVYRAAHPSTRATECFLFTREAAKKVWSTMRPVQLVIDWELAYQLYFHNLKVYWWEPQLTNQGSVSGIFPSELR